MAVLSSTHDRLRPGRILHMENWKRQVIHANGCSIIILICMYSLRRLRRALSMIGVLLKVLAKKCFLRHSKTISQEGQCTALHFSIFRIGKKGRNMNGLNLDEIAVLLERHGITCVVRNENGMEALRAFRGLPLPNRNDEQEDKLK